MLDFLLKQLSVLELFCRLNFFQDIRRKLLNLLQNVFILNLVMILHIEISFINLIIFIIGLLYDLYYITKNRNKIK